MGCWGWWGGLWGAAAHSSSDNKTAPRTHAADRRRRTIASIPMPQTGDMGDFAAVNAIYGRYFQEEPPARATFAVKTLPLNAKVEIEAVAVLE